MTEATLNKLKILAEAAKYDVSCSSSGTVRRGRKDDGVGNTVGGVGICHSLPMTAVAYRCLRLCLQMCACMTAHIA